MNALLRFSVCALLVTVGACRADDIQPLGDEFGNAATFSLYKENTAAEGWGASIVESANIDTSVPGHFRIVPRTCGWYEHLRGTHFSKTISGDFVATTHLFVYSRDLNGALLNAPGDRLFSLAGILMREPRAITHAAPSPYTTNPVWPPQNFGSDWTPGDENWANTSELVGKGENYIFLSYGTAGNANTRQFEIKDTRRSRSELYFASTGINQAVNEVWLQLVRVGSTVVCMRRHSAGGPWIVENRYPNPDHAFPQFGATLDVGITAYTDYNSAASFEAAGPQGQFHFNYSAPEGQPDLIVDVDYIRFQRPSAALTQSVLQSMSVSYNPATNSTRATPILLSDPANAAAAAHLGENANTPLGQVAFAVEPIVVNETAGTTEVTVIRSGASAQLPLTLLYTTTNGSAMGGTDFTPTSGSLVWGAGDSASKVIVIPLVANDGLAEGAESFSVELSQLDGPATFLASAPSVTKTVSIADAPLDAWRLAEFGDDANTAAAQPEADFDFDGLVNLVEFALHTSAVVPNPAPLAIASMETDAIYVTYPVRAEDGLTVTVEAGTALENASTWNGDGITYEAMGVPVDGVQLMRARVPVTPGETARFARLQVIDAPAP